MKRLLCTVITTVLFASMIGACFTRSYAADESGSGFMDIFGGELQVSGGMTDWVKDKGAVIVRNYATVVIAGRTIRARNIILYWQTKHLYAEGEVSVEDPAGRSFFCDKLYWDWAQWRGQIDNIRLRIHDPGLVAEEPTATHITEKQPEMGARDSINPNFKAFAINATSARAISKDHMEAVGVTLTPSMFARPHWCITTQAVNVRRDQKVESWHNILRIGRVPVMYIPYIIKDLKYDWPWMQFSAGSDGDWGYYAKSKWGYDFDPDENKWFRLRKMFLDTDFYQNRGFGSGLEFEYEPGYGESVGFFDSYYIKESMIDDDDDEERAMADVAFPGQVYDGKTGYEKALYKDEDRYDLDWWHRQQFNNRFDLRLEAHKAGDRDFEKEYFRSKYDTKKEDENSADLRYIAKKWELELVASDRSNDWQNQSSYMPELRFNVPGIRLGKTPFFLKHESTAGLVRKQYDETIRELGLRDSEVQRAAADKDKTDTFVRIHEDTRIYVPIKLGDWTLQPYAGQRATYYQKTYGKLQDGKGGDEINFAPLYGADLSTTLYGFYQGDTYRHTITPTIGYVANEKPTLNKLRFYDIDYIDNYEKAHYLTFDLQQTLQKKVSKTESRDIVDLGMGFDYIPFDGEADELNDGKNFRDLHFDLTWRPKKNLTATSYAYFDPDDGEVTSARVTVDYTFSNRFRVYLAHDYRPGSETDDYRLPDSNITTLALRTQLWDENSHWSLEYALQYEHESDNSGYLTDDGYYIGSVEQGVKQQKITFIRNMDTVELGLSYIIEDGDNGFMVELQAKGWKQEGRGPDSANDGMEKLDSSRYSRPSSDDVTPLYQP